MNTVNTQITQMVMRGAVPDNAIKAIADRFKVSKSQAGRLVMTESAAFANEARKDCFKDLDVEKYVIVETLDGKICDLCAQLGGKVYPMYEYAIGVTTPPFHPWCRGTTAPYFDDMDDIAERWARDPETGKTYTVPGSMTYKQWAAKQTGLAKSVKPLEKSTKSDIMTTSDVVERATGAKKGTPLDLQTAVQGANPNYTTGGTPYHVNCQRCVPTYEMSRRGYDVIAKPKLAANNTVLWGSEPFADSAGNPVSYTMNQTEAKVKRELKNAPDGARYGIYVAWKGRNGGAHVFIAEKQGGVVRYIDPQPGRLDASGYFALGRPGQFGYLRMDNLDITADESILQATVEVKQP